MTESPLTVEQMAATVRYADNCEPEMRAPALRLVWQCLDSGHRDQLRQLLFQGPVWDGCVVSKRARDELMTMGLATRCCFQGEQGYTAATYQAFDVFDEARKLEWTQQNMPNRRGTTDRD